MALPHHERILITGGRVIDPANARDGAFDVLIADGEIKAVDRSISADSLDGAVRVVRADGLVVCPGFIDIHTHLREPGYEYKETIATGAAAAARAVLPPSAPCPTPNRPSTTPPWWTTSPTAPPVSLPGYV